MPEPLAILLISPGHERAHYAFMLAAAAAAIGRPTTILATNAACHTLATTHPTPDDDALQAKGVATLPDLRAACAELGVRLLACDSGLRIAGLDPASLPPGIEITGLTAFLSDARAQLLTL